MRTVTVDLGDRSYDISIGTDVPVCDVLAGEDGLRVLIVSDSNVAPLHMKQCEDAIKALGAEVHSTTLEAGENTKDLKFLQELYSTALDSGMDRSSVVVALGGGVIGDLAGFLAATLLRGVRLIQVPTSLLALVDSSVGGKTGVNVPQGKNLVGSFYQPIAVDADLKMLETLPEREYISGLAEVIKYGIVWDDEFLTYLESNADAVVARDLSVLEDVVARCCEIKAEVVSKDERESGLRAILNYGHTVGHAIENVMGYGSCLHGEAVSVGMCYASELSVREKGLDPAEKNRLVALLKRFGLPTTLSDLNADIEWSKVRDAMKTDKKVLKDSVRFVLSDKPGSVVVDCEVSEDIMEDVFASI